MSKRKITTQSELVDLNFLRNITNGDSQFERELYEIFTESSESNVKKMAKSVDDLNDDGWYLASHSFKGAASSIGAFDLSKVLEYAQIHKKKDWEEKRQILKNVQEELRLVLDFLTKELEL